MPKRVKQYGLALVGVGVAVGVIAPAVIAAGDTDDFVRPVSTAVKTSLKTGTGPMYFVFRYGHATITSMCRGATTSGTTPAHGLVMAVKPMSFTNCIEGLSAHDPVYTYKTSGIWHITFLDAANDETTEPPAGASSGDRLMITIPEKGMMLISSFVPRCVITVAPTKATHIVGAFNDANTLTIGGIPAVLNGAPVPVALNSACPGGAKTETGHITATYTLTPAVHDAS